MFTREICDREGCDCTLETCSVTYGDRSYCSANCADGFGCEHEHCKCGRIKRQPPGFTSFIQGAVRHLHK